MLIINLLFIVIRFGNLPMVTIFFEHQRHIWKCQMQPMSLKGLGYLRSIFLIQENIPVSGLNCTALNVLWPWLFWCVFFLQCFITQLDILSRTSGCRIYSLCIYASCLTVYFHFDRYNNKSEENLWIRPAQDSADPNAVSRNYLTSTYGSAL